MKKLLVVLMAVSLLAAGCAQQGNKQTGGAALGAILGGAAGGLAGSQIGKGSGRTAATIVGAVGGAMLGGAIGSSIGKSMDDQDRMMAARALENNQDGQALPWQNTNTGRSYNVTPTRTYEDPQAPGRYCREYQTTVMVGGQEEKAYGKACRQPDGQWKIVEEN